MKTPDYAIQCQTCARIFTKFEIRQAECVVIGYAPGKSITSCSLCSTAMLRPLPEEELCEKSISVGSADES